MRITGKPGLITSLVGFDDISTIPNGTYNLVDNATGTGGTVTMSGGAIASFTPGSGYSLGNVYAEGYGNRFTVASIAPSWTRITGGLRIQPSNINSFTIQPPGSWLTYLTDTNTIIAGNTVITDGTNAGSDFIFRDNASATKLIEIFGDPGTNNNHGGLFNISWSAGSTPATTTAFILLYNGNAGPAPLSPGQYGMYVVILDYTTVNPIAGTWNLPATFTLLNQVF